MAVGVAFKAFFAALFNREASARIHEALVGDEKFSQVQTPKLESSPDKKAPATASVPIRSDALTLLSTLQREARLLDLVQESLDGFSDAQIGAAAREVLRDSRKTLDRLFSISPIAEEEEGSNLAIPSTISSQRMRLVGKTEGERGTVVHRGWQATCCELPKWNGAASEAMLLAPIEVEVS